MFDGDESYDIEDNGDDDFDESESGEYYDVNAVENSSDLVLPNSGEKLDGDDQHAAFLSDSESDYGENHVLNHVEQSVENSYFGFLAGTNSGDSCNGRDEEKGQSGRDLNFNEDCNGGRWFEDGRNHYLEEISSQEGVSVLSKDDDDWFEPERIFKMQFHTIDEAEAFYNKYAKHVGFTVRKDDMKVEDEIVIMRQWVCGKEGARSRKRTRTDRVRIERALTRENCGASFRVRLSRKSGLYIVSSFYHEHSHDLAKAHEVRFLRSNRIMKDWDYKQALAMQRVGIRPTQIMEYLVDYWGGYEHMDITRKDLYNKLATKRGETTDGVDSQATIAYLSGKAELEPNFFFKYTVDSSGRLENLFWRDTQCLIDYRCFGHVIALDSTYKTNWYGKPLVMILGVNHHYASTLFGFALLANETAETYSWVLDTFLQSMGRLEPISVVTDGDLGMRVGIMKVLPHCDHRLCAWHILQNISEHVHNQAWYQEWSNLAKKPMTVEDFEDRWEIMLDTYGVRENPWVNEMYDKRTRWVEAYLSGKFFAGMRSTQRVEGMNAYMNRYLKKKYLMHHLISQADRALRRLRNEELLANFNNSNSVPVIGLQLRKIQEHAASVYTHKMFGKVRKQIDWVSSLIVNNVAQSRNAKKYTITEYLDKKNHEWVVTYDPLSLAECIQCTCKLFESIGIPCSHIFCVIKHEQMDKIPESLIMRRWTKDAKSVLVEEFDGSDVRRESSPISRQRSFISCFNNLCSYATQTKAGCSFIIEGLKALMARAKEKGFSKKRNEFGIRDPMVVRPKGRPKGKCEPRKGTRRCAICKETGHDSRNHEMFLKLNSSKIEPDEKVGVHSSSEANF